MKHPVERSLNSTLEQSRQENRLRSLSTNRQGVDFCSNDYLGLSRSSLLRERIADQQASWSDIPQGSSGSRLISGNYALAESLEQELADFHCAKAGLLFNSGFAANTGLYASVAGDGDCLLMDELIHASSIDGARLSKADKLIFRHNDMSDLQEQLDLAVSKRYRNIFIGVESLYSMDGDCAPLAAIADMADSAGAGLIVDEAHTNGISGCNGAGMVTELKLEARVFARVHTFGKGIGLHGAIVLGSETLKSYLVNFARPFIFSTGPSHDQLLKIRAAYRLLPELTETRQQLFDLVRHFRDLTANSRIQWLESETWVQSAIIPGDRAVLAAEEQLRSQGYWVKAIRAPSVAEGTERIRICLHAFNTNKELEGLVQSIENCQPGNWEGAGLCADAS